MMTHFSSGILERINRTSTTQKDNSAVQQMDPPTVQFLDPSIAGNEGVSSVLLLRFAEICTEWCVETY
jgi:hypothetical protein